MFKMDRIRNVKPVQLKSLLAVVLFLLVSGDGKHPAVQTTVGLILLGIEI